MKFGYFTLSDNHYVDNRRGANQLVADILDEAIYAEEVGLHSAWIGEHHFSTLGVLSCPDLVLAHVAARTKKIRLAPAVSVLPLHHPIRVAEQWATLDLLSGGRVDFAAGRGYDQQEYLPFGAPFQESADIFAEGLDVLWRAWTEKGRWSHKGKYYNFENVEVRPRPAQDPLRPYVACFSRPSMELAARNDWNIIFAPFAAAMVYGSLAQATAAYREECGKHGRAPRRAMCSYFIHIGESKQDEDYGREALLRYFKDALIAAFPSDIKTVPPTLKYFLGIVDLLRNMKAENLTSKSILLGGPQKIIEDLKEIEAAGISEVILYFNYGLKPYNMVIEQMDRFVAEIMPEFAGSRLAAQ
jgi:alkanesulfonate monooxygenase SsuD/methylene tetrahydromethanopterin reductase-like flavin-dependent oxidoreductase (luciferase family)